MLIEIVSAEGALGVAARPRSGSGVAGEFIAGYLNSDLAGNAREARSVLTHLDAVQTGGEPGWSESANAYAITATANEVTLDFHWADDGEPDTVAIPLAAVREAVTAWIAMLERTRQTT